MVTTLYRPQSMPGTRAISTLSNFKFSNIQNIEKRNRVFVKALVKLKVKIPSNFLLEERNRVFGGIKLGFRMTEN